MDTQRCLYWTWIERGLSDAPDGMVYLSRAGRRMRKGFSSRWPARGPAREKALAELRARLEALADSWVVYFAEDGVEDAAAERWQWPAPAGGEADAGAAGAGYRYEEADPFGVPAGEADAPEVQEAAVFRPPAVPGLPAPGEREDRTREPAEGVPAEALGGGEDGGPGARDEDPDVRDTTRPYGYSEACAVAILQTVRAAGRRLTLVQMAEEFERRFVRYSFSTIQRTAPQMRREGILDNARDARGVGYGLPCWADGRDEVVEEPAEREG